MTLKIDLKIKKISCDFEAGEELVYSLKLNKNCFSESPVLPKFNSNFYHNVFLYQRLLRRNLQNPVSNTKTRGEVSGGGKKP